MTCQVDYEHTPRSVENATTSRPNCQEDVLFGVELFDRFPGFLLSWIPITTVNLTRGDPVPGQIIVTK